MGAILVHERWAMCFEMRRYRWEQEERLAEIWLSAGQKCLDLAYIAVRIELARRVGNLTL